MKPHSQPGRWEGSGTRFILAKTNTPELTPQGSSVRSISFLAPFGFFFLLSRIGFSLESHPGKLTAFLLMGDPRQPQIEVADGEVHPDLGVSHKPPTCHISSAAGRQCLQSQTASSQDIRLGQNPGIHTAYRGSKCSDSAASSQLHQK